VVPKFSRNEVINLAANGLRILLLFAVQVIAMQACRPSDTAFCPVEELILDETSFGEEVMADELLSPLPDGTKHSAGQTFDIGKGIANHLVYGFSTNKRAAEEFEQRQKGSAFSSATGRWQTPDEVRGLLASATQQQVVCGREHQIPMCKAIAQYDNYFIFFNIHVYPEETTIADLASLLQEIDDRMTHCLSSTPVAPNG
jgi:hypothetical protein